MNTNLPFQPPFVDSDAIPWDIVGEGVRRKIMAYDANLMMVLVDFDTGGVGAVHQHPHIQMSYVESGLFAITIDGEARLLKAGDVFYVASNLWHGAVCHEAGRLVDLFNPMRDDFMA